MGNRVEELETQVSELQAAVDGLTEELVETRARLETLEERVGVDELESAGARSVAAGDAPVEGANTAAADGRPNDGDETADPNANANADADGAPETAEGEDGADSEDDSDSTSGVGDDIIVA
jgi:TolA-binding protein